MQIKVIDDKGHGKEVTHKDGPSEKVKEIQPTAKTQKSPRNVTFESTDKKDIE